MSIGMLAELAIAYMLDLKGVTSLVMCVEKPEQARENIFLINCKSLFENSREKITGPFKYVNEQVLCQWLWNT